MRTSPPIERLVRALKRLPGIGEKSATRLAFHMLGARSDHVQELFSADVTFARGPVMLRAEAIHDRWEVPNVADDLRHLPEIFFSRKLVWLPFGMGETAIIVAAAFGLGAGWEAMDRAIPYSEDRIQGGSPLSEKQGYTHKLIIPHVVRLAAADAFVEEVAERLDSGEQDLEVEGSIAKLYATESANKAAEDAMQALGGYGYITEYEVEKIKRDVRITCIYEGTSEIQQTLISTMRWKITRKSKGGFYQSICDQMQQLHSSAADLGCGAYGLAAAAPERPPCRHPTRRNPATNRREAGRAPRRS